MGSVTQSLEREFGPSSAPHFTEKFSKQTHFWPVLQRPSIPIASLATQNQSSFDRRRVLGFPVWFRLEKPISYVGPSVLRQFLPEILKQRRIAWIAGDVWTVFLSQLPQRRRRRQPAKFH